jgi:hypothetical protein
VSGRLKIAAVHECDDWACDHWSHPSVSRFESFPFALAICRICQALVEGDGHEGHLEWHLLMGDVE